MSKLSHYNRRGVVVSTDIDSDRVTETKLCRCVHCQLVWENKPGSGRLRGFCQRCAGDVCGQPACVARGCVHWERQLELMERGLPIDFIREGEIPISVSVPAEVPRG